MKNRLMQLQTLAAQCCTPHLNTAACVTFNRTRLNHSNWGDELNYYFLSRLFRRKVCIADYSWLCRFGMQRSFLIIGSTISLKCTSRTTIWGAGFISDSAGLPAAPEKVLAVRGPHTRARLLALGIECPAVYGDPALLLPLVYRPKGVRKTARIGLIPHYTDEKSADVQRYLLFHPHTKLIRLNHYQCWTDVIDDICSCDAIISTSLHGLIAAEAYGIPNARAVISGNRIIGGDFKFRDFFDSIGRSSAEPVPLCRAEAALALWTPGQWDAAALIHSAPFPIYSCNEN